jgi:hypothetical protein
MNLHEYQAKELFRQFGVPTPKGIKVNSQQQAVEAAKEIRPGGPWVVAAQVHAGGRGKAGGVKFVRTLQDVEEVSGRLLGSRLVTKQTGAEGVPIHALLIRDGVDIAKEYYLSPQLRDHGRQHRLHGQRCRPGDGDHGRDQAGRRRAGQLPRRRRRRHCKERVTEAFKLILSSSQRQGHPGQHLRRHRPLRHDRRGHHRRRSRKSTSRCR